MYPIQWQTTLEMLASLQCFLSSDGWPKLDIQCCQSLQKNWKDFEQDDLLQTTTSGKYEVVQVFLKYLQAGQTESPMTTL